MKCTVYAIDMLVLLRSPNMINGNQVVLSVHVESSPASYASVM